MRGAQIQQVFPAEPESQPLYGGSEFLRLLNKHHILLPKWSRTVLPPTLCSDLLICYTDQACTAVQRCLPSFLSLFPATLTYESWES